MERCFTQPFVVVGAILENNGKVLLVKEGRKVGDSNLWNQPAGWLDKGENIMDAVKREVREETGFEFEPQKVLGIYSLFRKNHPGKKTDIHAVKIIFSGKIVGGKQADFDHDEILEIKWFSIDELESMHNQLRDLDIINEAKDCLAGKGYPLEVIHHFTFDENQRNK